MADSQEIAHEVAAAAQRKDGTVPAEDDVRRLLRKAMKGRDRAVIAEVMSRDLGRTVTPSMLADFTRNGNGKRQVRFPLAWTRALCRAVGCDDLPRSQLFELSRRALAVGELVLPWLLERGEQKLNEVQRRKKQRKPRAIKRNSRRKENGRGKARR